MASTFVHWLRSPAAREYFLSTYLLDIHSVVSRELIASDQALISGDRFVIHICVDCESVLTWRDDTLGRKLGSTSSCSCGLKEG